MEAIPDTTIAASFSELNLDQKILDSLKSLSFDLPTPVQAHVIPHALAGEDVLALAQTGTGKTAAFVIPILEKLLANPGKHVRALIVAPTRELASQIERAVNELNPDRRISSVSIVGGESMGRQLQGIRRNAQIVVACPGRLLDHLRRKTLSLKSLEVLVLDEADRMLDMGFQPALEELLEYLPDTRQTMMFSATMPDDVRSLTNDFLEQPKVVNLASTTSAAPSVDHHAYYVSESKKGDLALYVIGKAVDSSTLIFTRTRRGADSLTDQLYDAGVSVAALHGDLSQRERERAMTGFRQGRYQVLVATDIAARGIDVSTVGYVINFDMPDTVENFIHRVGRTGRANRRGEAHSFVTRRDSGLLRTIERKFKTPLNKLEVDGITEVPEQAGTRRQSRPGRGSAGGPRSRRPVEERGPAPQRPSHQGGSRDSARPERAASTGPRNGNGNSRPEEGNRPPRRNSDNRDRAERPASGNRGRGFGGRERPRSDRW